MLLIKLTPILYNLKKFRAFVLRLPTSKSNITFIANNTLTFSLSKKDIINTTKLNKFENTLFNFDNLHYLDDKYKDLNIKYPNQKKLTVSHKNLFTHIFNIITYQKNKIKLSGIILKRKKKTFNIFIFGLLGKINFITLLNNFTILWNKKTNLSYNIFIKLMLTWLYNKLHITINLVYLNFFLKIKNQKNKKSKSKTPLLLFTCNNIQN